MEAAQRTAWPCVVLRMAAIYNLAWGAWVVAFPNHLFDLTRIEHPNYPGIWQCVGMIFGVYGLGYWIASNNFIRHWPIVFVGLVGKILRPIGYVQCARDGKLPWSWGFTILTNDLVWWIPFAGILYLVFKNNADPLNQFVSGVASDHEFHNTKLIRTGESKVEQVSRKILVSNGMSLWEFGLQKTLLLVFVRHAGCTFCRETLDELKANLTKLTSENITPIVVHLGSPDDGKKMLERSDLVGVLAISNPSAELYRAYDLKRGQLRQLLGPRVWWRGFQSAILKGHGTGAMVGDGFQLGGAFLVENGRIKKSFPAKDAADQVPFECVLER